MSIYFPEKYQKDYPKVNQELLSLKGELTDRESKVALGKFLRANLGLGLELLTKGNLRLAPYQEILLKSIFNRNFSLIVASRGGAKTFLAAIIALLYPIYYPGSNIVICGPTFRTSRHIFNILEQIIEKNDNKILGQCFYNKSKRNDSFEISCNSGVIRALPMNSEKLRGFRCSVLLLDEFLLLSEEVIKKVLLPFLVVPSNVSEKMKKSDEEDELIKQGKLKEEDRMIFPSDSRMICLSSAGYSFEYIFQVYKEWIDNIMSPKKVESATYFVAQIGWEAIPKYLVNKSIIEEANSSSKNDAIFQREFGAQFVSGSESYFNAEKMAKLTIKDTERPTTQIKGLPDKKYCLSIDPNYNDSPTSDHFAMSILMLDDEEETATLVHNHACSGAGLKEYINYFYYLLNAFNIVMICCDNMDGGFINSANESSLFQENKIKIKTIDYDGSLEGEEYNKMLRNVRNQYNQTDKRICFRHVFNQSSIRRINEQLQTWINTSRIFFASRLNQHPQDYGAALNSVIPYPFDDKNKITMDKFIYDLIEKQDYMMPVVKKECALIEVSSSAVGGQTFDYCQSLKRNTNPDRIRKDSYTSLLLAIEGAKAYWELMKQSSSTKKNLFQPFMIGSSTYR